MCLLASTIYIVHNVMVIYSTCTLECRITVNICMNHICVSNTVIHGFFVITKLYIHESSIVLIQLKIHVVLMYV